MHGYLYNQRTLLIAKDLTKGIAYLIWRLTDTHPIIDRVEIWEKKLIFLENLSANAKWGWNSVDQQDADHILMRTRLDITPKINLEQYLTHPNQCLRDLIRKIMNEG